ncbi:hypothetical protein [Elizabethkingia bruuniana]|uniref:hypothetical protein n=1 Tax=Elizabethkingia bruuniana TaxID=1756149 RepID=UPI0009C6182D|nr:hypothetical protein [Elizabethkingia bruuniana]OPC53728.1 hypothetical protein BAY07_16970 [Elizabethkingia bruuniana]
MFNPLKLNTIKKYYVNTNAQSNGDHEVHHGDCVFLPKPENRKYLGKFYSCDDAVREAKKTYSRANGCKTCSKDCHTS